MLTLFAIGILAGITYYLYATPIYRAQSLVYFQSFGSPIRDSEIPETSTLNSAIVTRSLMDRLRSQQVQIAAAKRLGLLDDGESTIEALLEHVPSVVIGIVDARHLEVTVLAYDKRVVRDFCEALVAEFQRIQEETWTQFRDEALERYALQLTELEKKVAENVDSITTMERDQKFTEVTIEQQSLLEIPKEIVETRERIKRMDAIRDTLERYEAETETSDNTLAILSLLSTFEKETEVEVGNLVQRPLAVSRSGVIPGKPAEVQVVTPADIEGTEPWRKLEREKRSIETRIAEATAIYLPEHPKMKELAEELERLQRALQSEMLVLREKFDIEYRRLTEKLAQLELRIPEYQRVTEEFGRSSMEFSSIEQAQAMWEKARERLAEKLATITFAEDFDWIQLRFKGHTSLRDQIPVSPNKAKLLMISLIIGFAGAIGLPTILNLLDTSATSLAQLEDYIGLKGIGIVPLTDPGFLEEVHRSPAQGAKVPNYLLECFRVVRANIGLDAKFEGTQSQVILITSARPQEGKTTQAANLAWAFHSMGEKVLLIDCDLRRGRQHALLQLDNTGGMSRMLIGEISPEESILSTVSGSFEAIPRGPIIPGSTELLCQDRFFELVQAWRARYDRIIIDCPPVLGLSESTSLQRLADGIVLVVRSEKTSMKDVRDAVTILRKTGARFFGFVLNGVDLSKVGNYYQYYYYSAPYYDQFEEDPVDVPTPSSADPPSREPDEAPVPSKFELSEVDPAPPSSSSPPPLPQMPVSSPEVFRAVSPRPRSASQPERASSSLPARRTATPRNTSKATPTEEWSDSAVDQSWQKLQREKLRQQQDSEWQQPLERKPLSRRPTSSGDENTI
ncbi:MAG: polysaccharide biosynthesis tyrosine autokinase [Verrucomicrobiae bacterium]|nr:polysaccharide biosynthesis tyrosine autokinase [Verrucomicrobiae bacterium]